MCIKALEVAIANDVNSFSSPEIGRIAAAACTIAGSGVQNNTLHLIDTLGHFLDYVVAADIGVYFAHRSPVQGSAAPGLVWRQDSVDAVLGAFRRVGATPWRNWPHLSAEDLEYILRMDVPSLLPSS